MTRHDLIVAFVHRHPQFSLAEGEAIVTQVFHSMTAALARGEKIELRGFGVFGVKMLTARQRKNPRTGAPVLVAAQRRPFFKAAKEMQARLNPPSATDTTDTEVVAER